MSRSLLYILGEPGVGKTTVIRKITKGLAGEVMYAPYISWTHYSDAVCQIGYDREPFGGTDALGMASQKKVIDWLRDCPYKYVLAEGDRLANRKFFDAVREMGVELKVVLLEAPDELIEARRSARNESIGKAQDDRWLRTRKSKLTNLQDEVTEVVDASGDPREVAKKLLAFNVVKAIRKVAKSVE